MALPEVVGYPAVEDARFLNRELSWLDFNARVLALAEDATLPLLERDDMVGVRHLHLALIELDPPADDPPLAGRQQLLEVVLAAVEIGQAEPA